MVGIVFCVLMVLIVLYLSCLFLFGVFDIDLILSLFEFWGEVLNDWVGGEGLMVLIICFFGLIFVFVDDGIEGVDEVIIFGILFLLLMFFLVVDFIKEVFVEEVFIEVVFIDFVLDELGCVILVWGEVFEIVEVFNVECSCNIDFGEVRVIFL